MYILNLIKYIKYFFSKKDNINIDKILEYFTMYGINIKIINHIKKLFYMNIQKNTVDYKLIYNIIYEILTYINFKYIEQIKSLSTNTLVAISGAKQSGKTYIFNLIINEFYQDKLYELNKKYIYIKQKKQEYIQILNKENNSIIYMIDMKSTNLNKHNNILYYRYVLKRINMESVYNILVIPNSNISLSYIKEYNKHINIKAVYYNNISNKHIQILNFYNYTDIYIYISAENNLELLCNNISQQIYQMIC